MRFFCLLAVISVSIPLAACQSEKIDNSMIVDSQDGVSYTADIQPIFNRTCGGSGCHVGEATNGVNLTTHAQTVGSIGLAYGSPIVVAGNASTSPLVDKLASGPANGSRMPLGGGALSSSDIASIRSWIDDGALNN